MKILTRKKQDEILKLLAANLIIDGYSSMDEESFSYVIDNAYEIAILVDGIDGLNKVYNTSLQYSSEKVSELDKDHICKVLSDYTRTI